MLSDKEFEKLIKDIHRGVITLENLPENLYMATAEQLERALYQGFGQTISELEFESPAWELVNKLRTNTYIFSGAKTFHNIKDTQALLFDNDGFLRSFSSFYEDAKKVNHIYNVNWLQTEYNTVIAQADAAARWNDFESQKDVLPLLKYQTIGDSNVRPQHASMNGVIKPVNDPFWDYAMPPNGFNCYDNKTKVYTNNGWKFFEDLLIEDDVLTINPETYNLEYQHPISYIKNKHKGKMIEFKSVNFSACVTKQHKMLIRKGWDLKMKRERLKLINAENVAHSDQIYRSSKWIGENIKTIELAGKTIDIVTYVKFMAWYLSEGSITRRKDYPNEYQCKISQSPKKYLELIKEDLKHFPFKVYFGVEYVGINNKELGEYLMQFGKSFEKHIPNNIKELTPELINLFLDRYIKGDGHITKCQLKENGYKSKPITIITTSSEKMAGDLSELIIKSGKACSISISKNKGKEVKHRNGTYIGNYDIYYVIINNTKYFNINKNKINEIDYDGFVYCVEVQKYNTLLIQREGKIYWCGNCRCEAIQLSSGTVTKSAPDFYTTSKQEVDPLFRMNPAKDGYLFKEKGTDIHPYFVVPERYEVLKQNNFNLPIPKPK